MDITQGNVLTVSTSLNFQQIYKYFVKIESHLFICIYWKNNYRHEKYVTRKPKRNHWAYMKIELPQQRMSSYLDLFNCNGGKLRIQTHVTHTRHRKFLGDKE